MNWDRIEAKWRQLKGELKMKWAKLTDDDLNFIAGKKRTNSWASFRKDTVSAKRKLKHRSNGGIWTLRGRVIPNPFVNARLASSATPGPLKCPKLDLI